MVLVLPAWRSFLQRVRKHRVHQPTLPRDVKVNKHQTLHPAGEQIVPFKLNGAREKLSTLLANTFSNGCESRWNSTPSSGMHFRTGSSSVIVECVTLSTQLVNAFLNGFDSRCSGVRDTLHPAGERIFVWVRVPL